MEMLLVAPLLRWWLTLVTAMCLIGMMDGLDNVFTSVEFIKSVMRTDTAVATLLADNLDQLFEYKTDGMEYVDEHEQMEQEIDQRMVRQGSALGGRKPSEKELISLMAKNPLHAFQTIRRMTVNIHKIANGVDRVNPTRNGDLYSEFRDALDYLMAEHNITFLEDFIGSAKGILGLQDVYHLQAAHLAKGLIRGMQTSCRLTVVDCLLLGQVAKESRRMKLYVEWIEEASNMCHEMENKDDGKKQNGCRHLVGDLLTVAVKEHDEHKERNSKRYRFFPTYVKLERASEQIVKEYENFDLSPDPELEDNHLCYVGGRIMSPEEESKLFCHYLVKPNDPYLTLHRYKVEQQSIEFPHLVTIYDVLTSEEVDFMKLSASRLLNRSTVYADRAFSEYRVSATAWLWDTNTKLRKISKRIQAITGLSTAQEHSDAYQVVNYGIGGMFGVHCDYIYEKDEVDKKYKAIDFKGNRLVTFILYLSDVELGGATSFPKAKTAVKPQKGAAAMWFNLNEKMEPDERSLHSGCPVLYGSKWSNYHVTDIVANKWIYENGQMFRHPCPAQLG